MNSGFLEKISYFLEKLGAEPEVGALQISDTVLRYAFTVKDKPTKISVKLQQGVIEEGVIKDPEKFSEAAKKLRDLIIPKKKKEETVKAIITLPTSLVYTQIFKIPYVDDEKIDESVRLTMQMISPLEASKAYMGYEKINETDDQFEFLGAFASKEAVDNINNLLYASGFIPVSFEFPGLGLARFLRNTYGEKIETLVLLVEVSNDGIEFLILREGIPYFDYFLSWRKIQGSSPTITKEVFQESVAKEAKRVSNFVLGRVKENLEKVFYIAPGLDADMQMVLRESFGLEPIQLLVRKYAMEPGWYGVIGAAMRGSKEGKQEKSMSIGPTGPVEVFFRERLMNFLKLWRNILITLFSVLLIINGGTATYLATQYKGLNVTLEAFKTGSQQQELTKMEEKVNEFNRLVKEVEKVQLKNKKWYDFLVKIEKLAKDNNIILSNLEINPDDNSVRTSARALSQSSVIKFKNVILKDPLFENVELPLSRILVEQDNTMSFVLNFRVKN